MNEPNVPTPAASQLALDHIVLAGPDLDLASEVFAERTGVVPAPGGPHNTLGTRNALASLGPGLYVELIVPDPETSKEENLGGRLARLDGLELFAWALRSNDLTTLSESLRHKGFHPTPIVETTRVQPEGGVLVWDLMGLPGFSGAWPFFIDWRDCEHPSQTNPDAGKLVSFEVSLPVDETRRLPIADVRNLTIREGAPAMALAIETPKGEVGWSADAPRGF